jgi:hypothetical protein
MRVGTVGEMRGGVLGDGGRSGRVHEAESRHDDAEGYPGLISRTQHRTHYTSSLGSIVRPKVRTCDTRWRWTPCTHS